MARALGPLGYRLTALTPERREFGAWSRYFDDVVVCPAPTEGTRFTDLLLDRAPAWRGALVLETEDAFSVALSRQRDVLSEHYHLHVGAWPVVSQFLEKDRTAALAASVGVPMPRAYEVEDGNAVPDRVLLPAIVKPVRSHEFVEAFGTKLWVVERADALADALRRASACGIDVVVQELVPGSDHGTLESVEVYVDRTGRWAAEQYNVKLRQSPPMFGVMRVGRSVPPIQDVREATRRLLVEAGYRGYASAEFKRDPRDGVARLIEVNVRLPRNGALMLRSGTNFPHIVHQDLVAHEPVPAAPLRPATFIDVVADLGNLATRDRRLLRRPWFAFRPYLHRRKAFAVLSVSDPKPMAAMLLGRLRKRWPSRRP